MSLENWRTETKLIKIVYFDEESASDLLDMSEGGRLRISKDVTNENQAQATAEAKARAAARFDWIPFIGGSAEVGAAASASTVGKSILNKTLSNTILTDYLERLVDLGGVLRLASLTVTAYANSAAYMKMYTPYLAMLRVNEDEPVDLTTLDSVLESAKGYYELVGTDEAGEKSILRFNLRAFRNNYGLTDLSRMDLVFHGIRVGTATETSLNMQQEMSQEPPRPVNALDVVGHAEEEPVSASLNVYDVVLAGVEYGE